MPLISLLILFVIFIIFIALLVIFACTILYVLPMAKGAVYVPSKPAAIASMVKLAKIKKGTKMADLGCGDGRVVIAFAKAGAEAHGYEVNPLLVLRANWGIRKANLQGKAFIHFHSYWDVPLDEYEVISVYGITYIMAELGRKLKQELTKGSRVISNYFEFPRWKAQTSENGVHLYKI